jgi:phosphoenolpyruvate-protein kinase (PTS system EI component)
MPYFKDTNNKVHFLDNSSYVNLLPAGSVPISDEEAGALLAPTPEQIAAQEEDARDAQDAQDAKNYAKLQALTTMTSAQIQTWVQNNVNTLADVKDGLKTLAVAVGILARRL